MPNASQLQPLMDSMLFDSEIDSIFHLNKLKCSALHIAMMTLGVKTNRELSTLEIFTPEFFEAVKADPRFTIEAMFYNRKSKAKQGLGRGKIECNEQRINNSTEFKCKFNNSGVYVLIFEKGAFNITGCKKFSDAPEIVNALYSFMGLPPVPADSLDISVNLITSTFKLDCRINLEALYSIIVDENPEASFDYTKLAGVIIPRNATFIEPVSVPEGKKKRGRPSKKIAAPQNLRRFSNKLQRIVANSSKLPQIVAGDHLWRGTHICRYIGWL